ncbi:MAG: hydrogenase 3 maturation endopeptidase HyCI [Nitrososphaerota archaeon]|jgi:hydrogenase 3 maturation protease|nr:hydrogenase 3 maturation endopeptidase HyCI [Nitrososphaerota archaeon]
MPTDIYNQLKNWFSNATRVVIAGIGNPIRNDDFIGTKVVQQLQNKLSNNVYLIECETVPENYLLEIETFNPSHVLLIDAAMLKLTPGETRMVFPEQLEMFSTFTTHILPLQMFNNYLKKLQNTKTALLLIQPNNVEFGENISTELKKTADNIENILIKQLANL